MSIPNRLSAFDKVPPDCEAVANMRAASREEQYEREDPDRFYRGLPQEGSWPW